MSFADFDPGSGGYNPDDQQSSGAFSLHEARGGCPEQRGGDASGQRPQGMARAQAEYAIAQMERQAGIGGDYSAPARTSTPATSAPVTKPHTYTLLYPGKRPRI